MCKKKKKKKKENVCFATLLDTASSISWCCVLPYELTSASNHLSLTFRKYC